LNGAAKARKKSRIEQLEADNKLLSERLRLRDDEIASLRASVDWLRRQLFGARSEKTRHVFKDDRLISLFDEDAGTAENTGKPEETEEREVKAHKRRTRRQPTIEELKKILEVETEVIPLSDKEKVCPECGKEMKPVGKMVLVRSELVRDPARVYIKETYAETYACKDESHEETVFARSQVPPSVIMHSYASASTVAHVIDQKFRYAKTLYRMESEWKDLGVEISRQTMSNWVMLASRDWLQPILDRMKPVLLSRAIVHADETTFPLLPTKGSDRHRTEICYAWVYTTGSYEQEIRMAIYVYQSGRSGEYAAKFLEGYHGALQTDGYSGYNGLPVGLHALCWAHLRRKFVYALPEAERKDPDKSRRVAGEAIRKIAELFRIDKELDGLSPEERSKERLQREKPVLEALKAWLLEKKVILLPNSRLGEAVNYALKNWDGLTAYLRDGNCSLTNNICERTVRPFTIGRKNWLFSGSEEGAKASAACYSMAETCRLNGISFYKYLCLVFSEVPGINFHRYPELLDRYFPWSEYVQERCK